jgi:hypothetical protein
MLGGATLGSGVDDPLANGEALAEGTALCEIAIDGTGAVAPDELSPAGAAAEQPLSRSAAAATGIALRITYLQSTR